MNLKISWPMAEKTRLAQYIVWLEKRIAIENDKPCRSDKDAARAVEIKSAYSSYIELCEEWRRREDELMSAFERRNFKLKTPLKLLDMWLNACATRCTDDAIRKFDAIAVKAIGNYWRCGNITFDGTVIFEKLNEDSMSIPSQSIACCYVPDMQSVDGIMVDNGWLRVSFERCGNGFPATRYDGQDSAAQYYIEVGKFLADKEALKEVSKVISEYNREQSLLDDWTDKLHEEMKNRRNPNEVEYDD